MKGGDGTNLSIISWTAAPVYATKDMSTIFQDLCTIPASTSGG